MKVKMITWKVFILGMITFVFTSSAQEVHRGRVTPHERVNRTRTVNEEERTGRASHTKTPHVNTPEHGASAKSSADRMARNIIAEQPKKTSTVPIQHYSSLPEPRTVGEGRKATPAQKARILASNRERNGGSIKSDMSGKVLVPAEQARKGVKANMNQAEIDHVKPRSQGGSNSNSNFQVLSKAENLKKGVKQ